MKKITFLVLAVAVLLCSCNDNKANQANADLHQISKNHYFVHEVLANGNLLELYTDESGSVIKRGTVIDEESGEAAVEIDLSPFQLSNRLRVQKLKSGFCIIDRKLLFFNLDGSLIGEEELPKNRYPNTECAVSDDMTKMAYIMKEEVNEEDVLTLSILNFKDGSVEKTEALNAGAGKPSYYQSLKFTGKDDKILFFGVTNPTPDVCHDCYGWIDLHTKTIHMFEDENIEVEISGDSIWVYDVSVEKGAKSSGVVRQINVTNNVDKKYTLKNANESQCLRDTDDENCFITMLPDEEEKEVTFRLYKGGAFEKEAVFNFDDPESFEASTTGSAEFSYSTKADKVYFNYYTYADKEDWGTVILAGIYLGE